MKQTKILFFILFLLNSTETIAQSAWEMWFTAGYTRHHAFMVLDKDGMGYIRVKYFNPNTNRPDTVEETVKVENTTEGIRFACYNATYANTTIRHPTYVTDNFYMLQDEYGNTAVYNADDGGTLAKVTIEQIVVESRLYELMKEFGW